jgi:hypothetical protein
MRLTTKIGSATVGLVVVAVAAAASPGSTGAVRASGWGPVETLSLPAPFLTLVPTSAAVDSRGDTLAVWVRTDGSGAALMAGYRRAGQAWVTNPVPGSRGAEDADVAFDGSGEAVVVWTAGQRVRAVRRAARGQWAEPVTVARRPVVEPRPPNSVQLAVNRRGRAVVLWFGQRLPHAAIGFAGGRWGRAQALFAGETAREAILGRVRTGPASSSGDTDVVMDGRGRATVAWSGAGGFDPKPIVTTYAPGQGWSRPRAVAPQARGGGVPQIAGTADGRLAVAWGSTARGAPAVRVARKDRGTGWVQTPPLVHSGALSKVRIVMDGAGVVTAVWQTDNGATWLADQAPGGGWSPRVRVMPPGTAGDEYGLVANDAGDVLLGSTAPPGRHPVWAMRRSPSGAWQAQPTTVSGGRGKAGGPAVGIGPTGAGVLVWTFQRAGSSGSPVQARQWVP